MLIFSSTVHSPQSTGKRACYVLFSWGHFIFWSRKNISANTGPDIELYYLEDVNHKVKVFASTCFGLLLFCPFLHTDAVGSHYRLFPFYRSSGIWHLLPASTPPTPPNLYFSAQIVEDLQSYIHKLRSVDWWQGSKTIWGENQEIPLGFTSKALMIL